MRKFYLAASFLLVAAAQPVSAAVQHVVAFKFKPGTSEAARTDFVNGFYNLRGLSKRNGRPFILSITGGSAISKEGFDQGFEQMFIVTFKSKEDRDYFVGKPYRAQPEAAHLDLIKRLLPLIDLDASGRPNGIFVFDFEQRR